MEESRLGPWRLERELGKGGMATVHLARAEEDVGEIPAGRPVAIKIVHPHLLTTPGFFERFLREIEVGRSIRHENVVRTFDAHADREDAGGTNWMVMEYVEGQTLRGLASELGWVPEDLCRHIGREVAKALGAIHDTGIVHRDLKPENVLITRDDVVKVMDLGVARLADEALKLSQTGQFVGSMLYAAPEQFKGVGDDIDGRLDLYSLGMTLYEIACGIHPFRDANMAAIVRRQLLEDPRPLSELNPQVSPFLEEMIVRLLEKDRADRFQSAAELLATLTDGEESEWWRARSAEIREETKRPLRRIRIPRETGLYGRDREVGILSDVWTKVKSGEGRAVLVGGEAGIGKTRLVDEFAAILEGDGEEFNYLFGSYPPGGAATAAGAFNTAFREHFGTDGLEDRLREHLTLTPGLVPAFAAYLRGEPPPAGEEPLGQETIQTLNVHLVRALAEERPTIVLIDDLHFAPEEGRALFAALAMALEGHAVMLVGTARPELGGKWRQEIETLDATTAIEVGRITAADLDPLLRDVFRSDRLVERLGPLIAEKTDGNPFFVFEVIRGLREGQFVAKRDDGTWVATQAITRIEIPSSVKELVEARVSDLPEEEKDLLDVAACCGFDFDPVLVGEALGLGRIPTLKTLGRLEKKHRLVRSAGRRYVFDHHQVQEVLYEGLSELLREEYHAALADTLEETSGAADGSPADLEGGLLVELSDHFLRGRIGDRALPYLAPALDHLQLGYRNERILDLADRALAEPDLLAGADRVDMLLRKVGPLDLAGERDLQREVLDAAVKLSDEAGDAGRRAESRRRLGEHFFAVNAHDDALGRLGEAIDLAREADDRIATAASTGSLANVHLRLGKHDEARELYERQLGIAVEAGDAREEGRATGNLGIIAFRTGDREAAERHYERYLEISRETGDLRGEANAAGNLGILHHSGGEPEKAREWVELQMARAREIGDRRAEGSASGTLGLVLKDLGRLEEARERHERHREIAREIGDRRAEGIATGNLGLLLKKMGRFEEARECHETHLRIARETGDRRGEGTALLSLSTALEAIGRLGEARDGYEEQLELAKAGRDIAGQLIGGVNLGMLLASLGDADRALEVLAEARGLGEKFGVAEVTGAALNAEAGLAAESEPDRAREMLERSLELHRGAKAGNGAAEALIGLGRLADEPASFHREAVEAAEGEEEPGPGVLAKCLLAAVEPAEAAAARSRFGETDDVLDARTRMEARFALWRADGAEEDLTAAISLLGDLAADLEDEEVERFLAGNPTARAIRAAAG
ncbi:MAG: tetratricopeptide repeat protein [Planctomycetota bacterium]